MHQIIFMLAVLICEDILVNSIDCYCIFLFHTVNLRGLNLLLLVCDIYV